MKKILLIEDNDEVRENTAEILELANYQVLTAENGKVGVELAIQEIPDLIICDIMMPELDGYGVLHILNKREDTNKIPFIFLTAKAERTDFRKGMTLGADDYLTKPFDDTELLDAIEIRLKKAERLRETPNIEDLNQFLSNAKSRHRLEDISQSAQTRSYKKKSYIYSNGDIPRALFLINKGKVKTFATNEEGKELIMEILQEGDFFGYKSLLVNEPYNHSAYTLEESELAMIGKEDFFALLYHNFDVAEQFIQMLCNRVSEKEERLLNLAYNTVRQRTAEALMKLYEDHQQEEISITRDDLAKMVGTATESVIRVLSEFKDENLVQIKTGKIKILAADKLQQVETTNYWR